MLLLREEMIRLRVALVVEPLGEQQRGVPVGAQHQVLGAASRQAERQGVRTVHLLRGERPPQEEAQTVHKQATLPNKVIVGHQVERDSKGRRSQDQQRVVRHQAQLFLLGRAVLGGITGKKSRRLQWERAYNSLD